MEFPDQSKFNRVCDALWKRSPSATIMVGAGFSKNAEIVKSSTLTAPSWTQLTKAMCEKLYPQAGDGYRESAIAASAETSGALRYAQEYERAFGRTDLHSFLRTHVRDDHMRPGEMHRRLLRLPWRDVFTTNWDTLLERTCSEIPERSYSILRNSDEIPLTASPRIIKLHGSLDGHFPLIFTEEDYRTYPALFAPFVNTVQQSMMETVFCLLGFSGDDPNFLHWSGWVRDNLQLSAPKIYLAGWLELSEHRREMLEARNVIPIDLARHPQAMEWPKALRHQRATDWILRSLEGGRPYETGDWPSPSRAPTSPTPEFLEPIQRVSSHEPRTEPMLSSGEAQTADDRAAAVRMLIDVWRHNRRVTYPGWLTAPSAVRNKMWSTTEGASAILDALPDLTTIERLNAIREIMWRRQIQLQPLSLVEATSARLEQEAKEVLNSIDCVNQGVDGEELRDADWAKLREAWVEVGLDLVWASRLRFDEEEFNARVAAIVPFQDESDEVRHRIRHEQVLWKIFSLDYDSVDNLLSDWDVDTADPIWMMRKAALLFEIGKDEEAAKLNTSALERTRQSSQDDKDVNMLSRESWALYCAGATLSHEELWYASIEWQHRWDQLTPLRCNAPLEMRYFAEAIRGQSKPEKGVPFDLGNVWRGGFSFSDSGYRRWVASHRAVRLPEIVGLPPTVRSRIVAAEILELAARQLVPYEEELSARIVLRAARHEANGTLNVVLSRTNIAIMPTTTAKRLAGICVSAIDYILPRISDAYTPRHWPERLAVLMEALSRFILRLEASEVGEIFGKAFGWYGDNLISRHIVLADPMRSLLSRSWEALAIDLRREKIVEVLGAPLVDLDGFTAGLAGANRYPDPCVVLDKHPAPEVERTPETENQWREVVGLLIRGLRTRGEARKRAVLRLSRLVELKVATEPELAELAHALWDEGGAIPDGLPGGSEVFDWVFMVLPEPTPGLADERFRTKWLDPGTLDGANAQPTDRILWEVGGAINNLEALGARFSLSEQERHHLAEVVRRWVLEPIPKPLGVSGEAAPMFADNADEDIRKAITGLQYILLEVEIPGQCGEALLEKSQQLNLTEMPARVLSVGLIKALPERTEDVVQALRIGLASDDKKTAQDAVIGLQFWLEASSRHDQLFAPPIDLVQEIGVIIFTRRKAALLQALLVAKWIMHKGNAEQRSAIGSLIVQGLGYLFEQLRYETAREEDLDVPVLRWSCTNLAVSMSEGDWAEETAIVRWVENATDDPLPEIRSIGDNLR